MAIDYELMHLLIKTLMKTTTKQILTTQINSLSPICLCFAIIRALDFRSAFQALLFYKVV